MPPMNAKDVARFMSKIEIDEYGCWNWKKATSDDGYGRFKIAGKCVQTHRLAYTHFIGAFPQYLELDHKCVNPSCCNPAHLEPVTKLVNLERKSLARSPQTLATAQ